MAYNVQDFRAEFAEQSKQVSLGCAMILTAALAVARDRWTDEDTKTFGTFARDIITKDPD